MEVKHSLLEENADSITYNFINHTDYNRVFIFEDEVYYDLNSRTFGGSGILFSHESECEIIFGREELEDILMLLEVDTDNLDDYYAEIKSAVLEKLEQVLLYDYDAKIIN